MSNIVTIDGIPVYQALVDAEGDTGMLRISLVDDPAVMSNFLAFSKQEPERRVLTYAIQDEEKRRVLGVVMRADFPIYRKDKNGDEFYIIYKADTILTMAEKYLAENRQNDVNLMHFNDSEVEGVQMVQWFIKDTAKGLAPEGFGEIADGSLFAEFHVTNDEVWEAIKDGTYKGFSLEGIFNLTPEEDKAFIQEVVDTLEGKFATILKSSNMTKLKGLLARIAKAVVSLGNISTDKGVISWDGEDDLKAGDAVYLENEDGTRTAAADGEYVTSDGKTIIVVDGKVSEIKDNKAEVAPQEGAGTEGVAAETNHTDTGTLVYEGDLAVGTAVQIVGEGGETSTAPDGEYTAADGKVISVVDGKVASITDPEAEVAEQKMQRIRRIAEAFQETYNDKMNKLYDAIVALGFAWPWLVEAGDEFVIASIYTDNGDEVFYRFNILEWDEEGKPVLENGVKVVPAFVTPEEKEAVDAEFSAVKAEKEALAAQVADLTAQVEALKAAPGAKAAHEEFNNSGEGVKTGVKGLYHLAKLMAAK